MLLPGTSLSSCSFVSGDLRILGEMAGIAAAIQSLHGSFFRDCFITCVMCVSFLSTRFPYISFSGLLLGFCFLFMHNVICTICDF